MQIIEHFTDLTPVNIVINFIDVLLVWYVVYKVLTLIKGTKAVQLLKGIFVIIIARIATDLLGLQTLGWMLQQVIE
ncbi:MAG: TIGR00159 family protein, partial [Lactobacillus sp.]|nr:TIGR00159 family protein [Lactobacillus sp.]